MKKSLLTLLSILLISLSLSALTACGGIGSAGGGHTHAFGEWYGTPATCEEGGSEKRDCTADGCDYSEPRTTEALGHDYEEKICKRCGEPEPSEGLSFFSNGNGGCRVTGIGSCTDTAIKIPAVSPDGDKVVGIDDEAFKDCTTIEKIIIPSSVYYISNSAFSGCTGLTEVKIPNSITRIGYLVFEGCTGLKSIEIPESVTDIDYSVFSGCTSLESISLPCIKESLEHLFYEVPASLKSVTVLNGTCIKSDTFEDCSSLTSITLPDSITTIEEGAFRGCAGLEEITLPDGIISIESAAFEGCTGLKSFVIPDGVSLIENSTFEGCTSLESVTLPSRLARIQYDAFKDCTSLTDIEIPDCVTSLDAGAFYGCTSLEYHEYDNAYYLGNDGNPYRFLLSAKRKDIVSCEIAPDTKVICVDSFGDCVSLESITIPSGVTTLDTRAFKGCKSLTDIALPDSVTYVGHDAFAKCSKLASISIPDAAIQIASSAFGDCESLVYNEYDNAYYLGNEENPYVFLARKKDDRITSCEIAPGTKVIGVGAFAGCTKLESLTLPEGVEIIDGNAFYGCSALTSFNIPSTVKYVGDDAFDNCSGITEIENGVYYVGKWAVDYWDRSGGARTAELRADTVGIARNLFERRNFDSMTIPASVKFICAYAFDDCLYLESVIFENTEGWSADGIEIPEEDLADASRAADCLSTVYSLREWRRN